MDVAQRQQALASNRIVEGSSSSSSVGQAAYRVTTTMKDVWDHVKGGNGNVMKSWNTIEMKKGEEKFMNSLATLETLSILCHAYHERHFAKNAAQVQAKVCPKCVYDPNHKRKRDRRVVVENSNQCFYLLSHDNDMDPFYVHDTVLIRARKWRTTQNLQDISDMALRSMIETEFRALPELTLVEKCMISLAVPIMTIGRAADAFESAGCFTSCKPKA